MALQWRHSPPAAQAAQILVQNNQALVLSYASPKFKNALDLIRRSSFRFCPGDEISQRKFMPEVSESWSAIFS